VHLYPSLAVVVLVDPVLEKLEVAVLIPRAGGTARVAPLAMKRRERP